MTYYKNGEYIMNFWDALIQGIVQGLTEFLPVSSSGHVSLVQHFTGKNIEGAQAFTLFLHFGTLIAVFIAYWKTISSLILEFFAMVKDLWLDLVDVIKGKNKGKKYRKHFNWNLEKMNEDRRMVIMVVVACACAILLFLPLFGFLGLYDSEGELVKSLSDLSEYTSEDASIVVEGICLIITGCLLLYATSLSKKRRESGEKELTAITYKSAIAMGVGQCIAAFPGLSRSGTTTTAGMITGTEKNKALEFSFIIGIPAVLAANVLELVKMDDADWAEFHAGPVIIGVIVSAVVGVLAIAGLRWIVSNDKLHYFGYYCLIVGALVVIIAIAEKKMGVDGIGFMKAVFGGNNDAVIPESIVSAADAVSASELVSVADVIA